MKPIYHYVFHYNSYRKLWACVDREAYNDYLNGTASYEHVTYAPSIDLLLTQFNDAPTQDSIQEEESKESVHAY